MNKNKVQLESFTTFGDLLKYLRIRAQLTQREFSIAVGYSEAQISRQESNKRVPSEYALKALFVPALGLEDEPEAAARLLMLAAKAREKEHSWTVSNPVEDSYQGTAAQSVRHNLPRQLSSFIGREKEIAQVVKMVREHPLVTLTGAGGVGKTRLALHAAKELVDDFPDGVWLVEFAPVIDPVFIPIAVASIFKVHSATGQRLVQTLREYFAPKCLLLVLDNCEHVIDAVAELSTNLLEGCPKLSILATSREILDVEGEFFFRCPSLSLPVPSPAHPTTDLLKRVEASEAARLFIDRAAAASPGFHLTEKNALAVSQICQRLDGIPLAIELAAARLRLLSLDQIAGYMDDVIGLLAGSRRSVLPRHKTLKALIEWSYQLLSPAEQLLLRRLSVFAGGWTLEAAEAVCNDRGARGTPAAEAAETVCAERGDRGTPAASADEAIAGENGREPGQVLDRMQRLADKSLIFVEPAEIGENRYYMLETIRQYANEKIQEAGEYSMVRARHLAFFTAMAEEANSLDSNHRMSFLWTQRLMKELDNVRLALEWSLETNIELGLRLGILFSNAVPFSLLLELGIWLDRLLAAEAAERARLGIQRDDLQFNLLRGEALLYVGGYSYLWGLRARSEQALLESIALFEAIGEPADLLKADGLMHLGTLIICTDPEQSRVYLEGSRNTIQRMDEKIHLSQCDRKLVALNLLTGQLFQARQFAEEDLQISKETGGDVIDALEYRGSVEFLMGNFAQAINYYRQAQENGVQYVNLSQAAYEAYMEGCVALAQGDGERVLCISEEMLNLGRETGNSGWFFHADLLLALLEWTQGAYDQAEQRSEEGLSRYYAESVSFTAPFAYVLGRVALVKGKIAKAEQYFRQMDEMANAPTLWKWKAYSLHAFGLLSAAQSSQQPDMAQRAVILFGAQERLFAWLQRVLSPFERNEYARALAMVKQRLSEEAFLAAWDRGQAMSYHQAFAYALAKTSEDPIGSPPNSLSLICPEKTLDDSV